MIRCMCSARPITPSSATLLCAEITSSMPGRRAATSRSPLFGWRAPPGPKIASYASGDTGPSRPSAAAPVPPQRSGVSPRDA